MYVKICGITKPEQGVAIEQMGANGLGFICVSSSPRYVDCRQICEITDRLSLKVDRIGVFLDAELSEINSIVTQAKLNVVQLHGNESPVFCDRLRHELPDIKIIKALRIATREALDRANLYANWVDAILLDAYDPRLAGGTGKTIDWNMLAKFRPDCDWWLAGGLSITNITTALEQVKPDGVDISSGVEQSPGDKDLEQVRKLLAMIDNQLVIT